MRSFPVRLAVLAVIVGTLLVGAHPGVAADKWMWIGPSITVKYIGDSPFGDPQWEVTGKGFGPTGLRQASVVIYVTGAWCGLFGCTKRDANAAEDYLEVWPAQLSTGGEEFCWNQKCGFTGTFRERIRPFYLCYVSVHAFDGSDKQRPGFYRSNEVRLDPHGDKCKPGLKNHQPPGSTVDGRNGQLIEHPLR